jgi:hypothetical protein
MEIGIFQTKASGEMQGDKLYHKILPHSKFGNILAPASKAEYDDLKAGGGYNRAYWEISPEDLKMNGADLRLYKIIPVEKVDKIFALPEADQSKVFEMLNMNLDSILEQLHTPALKKGKKGTEVSEPLLPDAEEPSERSQEESEEPEAIPYKEISEEELKEILKSANIPFSKTAKKRELYDLVYPDAKG